MTDFDKADVFLTEAAKILWDMLLEVKRQAEPLPLSLKVEHFQMGQAPTPDRCVKFIQNVICQDSSNPTERERRISQSIGDDLLFNATKGFVKPAKYLCVGIGMKSMAGSDNICKILHRLCHEISWTQEGEIITEIAKEIAGKTHSTPGGICLESGLATAINWDSLLL